MVKEVCKECNGEGSFTVDYHDPASFYGHGQYEILCECRRKKEEDEYDPDFINEIKQLDQHND